MKEPVDHILRPMLPWRRIGAITECGLNAEKIATLTRPAFFARMKELGQQRTAMLTCMTCSDTARRWGTWDDDPRRALEREIQWECARYSHERGVRLRDELLAIVRLIEKHREEFDSSVTEIEQRRAWVDKKNNRPQPKKIGGIL